QPRLALDKSPQPVALRLQCLDSLHGRSGDLGFMRGLLSVLIALGFQRPGLSLQFQYRHAAIQGLLLCRVPLGLQRIAAPAQVFGLLVTDHGCSPARWTASIPRSMTERASRLFISCAAPVRRPQYP